MGARQMLNLAEFLIVENMTQEERDAFYRDLRAGPEDRKVERLRQFEQAGAEIL